MDYIKEQAGLDGKIDEELETPEAVKNVSASGEGFVIFGMHGKDSGHAVGLYRNRDGVRFFDPNYGEVFFEDRADFQGFLSEFVDLCSRDVLLYAAEKEAREAAATDEHQRAEKHNAAPVKPTRFTETALRKNVSGFYRKSVNHAQRAATKISAMTQWLPVSCHPCLR